MQKKQIIPKLQDIPRAKPVASKQETRQASKTRPASVLTSIALKEPHDAAEQLPVLQAHQPRSHAIEPAPGALASTPPPCTPAAASRAPSSSPSADATNLHLHLPHPSTAARAFLWLSDCRVWRVGDLHHEPHPLWVGAAHDHETTATPGPVLRGMHQQLEQPFESRAVLLSSSGDVWYPLAGGVASPVDDGLISTPAQQQVRDVGLTTQAGVVQRGFPASPRGVDIRSQLQ